MQFYGSSVVASGELPMKDFGIEGGLDDHRVRAGLKFQMQLASIEMTALDGVGADRRDQLADISSAVATKGERNIELAFLLAGGGALKIAGGVIHLAAGLGLESNRPSHQH